MCGKFAYFLMEFMYLKLVGRNSFTQENCLAGLLQWYWRQGTDLQSYHKIQFISFTYSDRVIVLVIMKIWILSYNWWINCVSGVSGSFTRSCDVSVSALTDVDRRVIQVTVNNEMQVIMTHPSATTKSKVAPLVGYKSRRLTALACSSYSREIRDVYRR